MAKTTKKLSLSIVIPVYNEERYLSSCLDSIAAQTVQPLEVIVVDNGSTDGSVEIAKQYPFVRVITEDKRGIVYARNAGFNAARGEIIGRIDADCVLPKTWAEHIQSTLTRLPPDTARAVTGPSHFRNLSGWFWYVAHRIGYFYASRVWMGCSALFGSNMYMSVNAWQLVKDEVCLRTDIHEDMDLAYHLHHLGIPVGFDKRLVNRMMGRGVSFKVRKYLWMFLKIRFISHEGSGRR
jgi:glycosyltransferase involved in cell wall biosynthesis